MTDQLAQLINTLTADDRGDYAEFRAAAVRELVTHGGSPEALDYLAELEGKAAQGQPLTRAQQKRRRYRLRVDIIRDVTKTNLTLEQLEQIYKYAHARAKPSQAK